jgi:excisionase family DNA binding protein
MSTATATPTAAPLRPTMHSPKFAQPLPDFLSLQDAAALSGLHPDTLRNAIRDGRLAAFTIGKRYVVTRAALEEFRTSLAASARF